MLYLQRFKRVLPVYLLEFPLAVLIQVPEYRDEQSIYDIANLRKEKSLLLNY